MARITTYPGEMLVEEFMKPHGLAAAQCSAQQDFRAGSGQADDNG